MMTGCGSVLWMAPEILLGKQAQLAVCLYHTPLRSLPFLCGVSGISSEAFIVLGLFRGIVGEVFNEKIDVYSYAMCLVELVDFHLPW